MSVNIRRIELFSTDATWQRAYVEVTAPSFLLHKICRVHDLTLCVDRITPAGDIPIFNDPVLYRVALEARVRLTFPASGLLLPCLTQCHLLAARLDFSLSDVQVPLLASVLAHIAASMDQPGSARAPTTPVMHIRQPAAAASSIAHAQSTPAPAGWMSRAWALVAGGPPDPDGTAPATLADRPAMTNIAFILPSMTVTCRGPGRNATGATPSSRPRAPRTTCLVVVRISSVALHVLSGAELGLTATVGVGAIAAVAPAESTTILPGYAVGAQPALAPADLAFFQCGPTNASSLAHLRGTLFPPSSMTKTEDAASLPGTPAATARVRHEPHTAETELATQPDAAPSPWLTLAEADVLQDSFPALALRYEAPADATQPTHTRVLLGSVDLALDRHVIASLEQVALAHTRPVITPVPTDDASLSAPTDEARVRAAHDTGLDANRQLTTSLLVAMPPQTRATTRHITADAVRIAFRAAPLYSLDTTAVMITVGKTDILQSRSLRRAAPGVGLLWMGEAAGRGGHGGAEDAVSPPSSRLTGQPGSPAAVRVFNGALADMSPSSPSPPPALPLANDAVAALTTVSAELAALEATVHTPGLARAVPLLTPCSISVRTVHQEEAQPVPLPLVRRSRVTIAIPEADVAMTPGLAALALSVVQATVWPSTSPGSLRFFDQCDFVSTRITASCYSSLLMLPLP